MSPGVVLETTARREAERGQSTNRKGEMSRASHSYGMIRLTDSCPATDLVQIPTLTVNISVNIGQSK